MHRALELAIQGQGAVEPNPMVGAVVVRDGKIIGEGWHKQYGGPHAEVFALNGNAEGATLYVTLEPCCHHGKTPPCSRAVIAAGVRRVVVAMSDPFPRVAGGGIVELRAAGIEVEVGVCEAEAKALNAPYLTLIEKMRPWVVAKWAMTLDGRIATRTGESKWISNDLSRSKVHQLRGRVDAVIIGSGTALTDNPMLTARPPGPRVATRVVLDRRGRLPIDSELVKTARNVPTIVVGGNDALREAGCEILDVDLPGLLRELGNRRLTNVLVEGGAGILGAFFDAKLVDEVEVFLAPIVMGGQSALSPIGGQGVASIDEGIRFKPAIQELSGDVWIRGRLSAV